MTYTTRTTWIGHKYGCRVFDGDVLVVEGRCLSRDQIGATFRDLMRTIDKCGGDEFTSSARSRKFEEGNPTASVMHYWGGKFNAEMTGAVRVDCPVIGLTGEE